jgi:hypothetical protein
LTLFTGLVDQPVQDLLRYARHLFVATVAAWVHPGSAGNRQIRTLRQGSPPWSREVLGAANAGVITRGCPAVHWHIDFLVALPSAQDLLLCANICSSLPWWLGFIPGLPRIGNSAGFFILSQLRAWAKKPRAPVGSAGPVR